MDRTKQGVTKISKNALGKYIYLHGIPVALLVYTDFVVQGLFEPWRVHSLAFKEPELA
jgi:hypothetical protein